MPSDGAISRAMSVRTGDSMRRTRRSITASASSLSVTTSQVPRPARAISSSRKRFTLLPMPKLNTREARAFSRTAATIAWSLPM